MKMIHCRKKDDFMFVVIRNIKVEKQFSNMVIEKFSKPSPIHGFEGFDHMDLLLDSKDKAYDTVKVVSYWVDKPSFHKWLTSKEHKEGHKASRNADDKPKFTIIETTFSECELQKTILKSNS